MAAATATADAPNKKSNRSQATSTRNRRARKKRRTDISSSEEDSSSSSSSEEEQEEETQPERSAAGNDDDDVRMDVETAQQSVTPLGGMEIEHLRVCSASRPDDKTAADVVQTRLKLRQTQALSVGSADEKDGEADADEEGHSGPSSDAWLQLMLAEYGDDIDTLRKTAGDFRGESVTLIAELLRATRDVFREV